MTAAPDRDEFNQRIIEEFRANAGKVTGPFAGAPMLLLTTTGAKSGRQRTTPLVYLPDGDRFIIFAEYQTKTTRRIPVIALQRW